MPGVTTTTRSTGLIAKVIDDNLNSFEDFAGTDINVEVAYKFVDLPEKDEYDPAHWQYRGQAALCARTTDGALVRVRIGDGSASNRAVYRQIITDPTDTAQWLAWTQLYSGTHYAVAIEPDAAAGAGYRVFHSKSDGLYVDNVLKIALVGLGIVKIKPTAFDTGRIYYCETVQDTDGGRALRWYYTPDINAGSPTVIEDCAAYRWYRHDLVCMKSGTSYYRFRSMAHEAGSRHRFASEQLTIEGPVSASSETVFNEWNNVRFLKGPTAQAGFKNIENLFVTSMASPPWAGAYYLFYNERHRDINGEALSNLKNPLFWQRSIGFPYYLSAPTPVGFSIWGFAGAVQFGNYIYVAGNGRVLRRSALADTVEITNNIIEGEYDIPRANQKAAGKLICANPRNVLGKQLGLTDQEEAGLTERRVEFGIGQKSGALPYYLWKRDAAWWISKLRKLKVSGRQHLEMEIGDFWHRLENPFRDTLVLPGRFEWDDWRPDSPNQLYNYSNDTDEFQSYNPAGADANFVPRLKTTVSGDGPYGGTITLFAGWRGENGQASAYLWADGGIIFRYVDVNNFFLVKIIAASGTLQLIRYKDGVPSTLSSSSGGAFTVPTFLSVDFRWNTLKVDVNFGARTISSTGNQEIYTGFAGFTSPEISNFNLEEWHTTLTTKDLLRMLLAYVEEHEVVLELDEETAAAAQLDMHWGPQSDLDTPEKAFRQIIEASNLQTVFLES